ncbi:PI-PLC domain-containing protein [Pseudomonas sp. TMB3-21]
MKYEMLGAASLDGAVLEKELPGASMPDIVLLASALDVRPDDLDANGNLKDLPPPVFGPYVEDEFEFKSIHPGSLFDLGAEDGAEINSGWCPGGSASGGVCKPFNNNRTHWMSTYSGVRNLPIHMAILPGTHNSAFDKQASTAPSSEVCQDVSPHVQLNSGIRVLDIRVQYFSGYPVGHPSRFSIFHSTTNGRTVQYDIVRGVKSYHYGQGWDRRREIVILDFHEFKNFTVAAHAELISILKTSFGDSIISPTYKELSISQIWRLPGYKNTVIAYNNGARDSSFWPGVNQRWIGSNTPSESQLKAFIDRVGSESKPAGELRSIQAARYVLPFFVPKDMSGQLMSWFAAGSAGHPIMKYFIINCDWSLRHRLVDNIIHSNYFRAQALGLQDLKYLNAGDPAIQGTSPVRHAMLSINNQHWAARVTLPPIVDDEPHRLLVCSDADAEIQLDLQGSDVALEHVTLVKGDALAFVCLDGSRRWALQVQECTPAEQGHSIPAPGDGEKFIRYAISHGNYAPLVSLPKLAEANSVVMVVSIALLETRIRDGLGPNDFEHVIRPGETCAFTYDAETGSWSLESVMKNVITD